MRPMLSPRHATTSVALCLLLSACVTADDIRDVRELVETREAALRDGLDQVEADQALIDGLSEKVSDIDARTDAAFDRARGGVTGIHPLLDLALAGVGAAFGVNAYRNRKRRDRGEKV